MTRCPTTAALVGLALVACSGSAPASGTYPGPCTETSIGAAPARMTRVRYGHDARGRVIARASDDDADGQWESLDLYVRDRRGLTTARLRLGPGPSELFDLDPAGRTIRRTIIWSGRVDAVIDRSYDDDGRLVLETDGDVTTRYAHDDRGRLIGRRETAGDRVREDERRGYDRQGRLTDTWWTHDVPRQDGQETYHAHHAYDAAGMEISATTEIDGVGNGSSRYQYDADGRRTIERSFDGAGALVGIGATTYDHAGNPTSSFTTSLRSGATWFALYNYACWADGAPPAPPIDAAVP